MEECMICGEELEGKVYKHHVVPRSCGGKHGETIKCCYTCNHQIHMLFSNKELARMSLSELLQKEETVKYIKWKKKHKGKFRHRLSKRLRNR